MSFKTRTTIRSCREFGIGGILLLNHGWGKKRLWHKGGVRQHVLGPKATLTKTFDTLHQQSCKKLRKRKSFADSKPKGGEEVFTKGGPKDAGSFAENARR